MISTWMLYVAATSLLLGLGALAAERVLLGRGRPIRWIWIAAVAGSVALPTLAAGISVLRGAPTPTALVIPLDAPLAVAATGAPIGGAAGGLRLQVEQLLAVGWLASSLLLLAGIVGSLAMLERRQRRWRYAKAGGRMVLVSENTGPATLGFLWPRIVVPRWVLAWDEAAQRRLIGHEQEHEGAGDPWLLLGGAAALVLLPWNLLLWWQVRRLRLAIEVDCDARVLRALPGARAYGLLLLEVGQRASRTRIPVTAFSEPCSLLERRIQILAGQQPLLRRPARVALWGVTAAMAAAATALPVPEQPGLGGMFQPAFPAMPGAPAPNDGPAGGPFSGAAPPGEADRAALAPIRLRVPGDSPGPSRGTTLPIWTRVQPRAQIPMTAPLDAPPRLRNYADLVRLVQRHDPGLLPAAGAGGTVLLWAHVDAAGRVVDVRTARTSGSAALDRGAGEILRQAVFLPAQRQDRPVDAWIQVPVTFEPDERQGLAAQ